MDSVILGLVSTPVEQRPPESLVMALSLALRSGGRTSL